MLRFTKEQLMPIFKESFSIADVCRKLGWEPRGDNYKVIHRYINIYELDTSHFLGRRTNIGNKNNVGISIEEYFKDNKIIKGSDLMKKLINTGLKEYKCEECGLTEWNGKQIKLQIHHINGNPLNNNVDNLKILCPNCHSQTDNFTGRANRGKFKRVFTGEYKHKCKNCGKRLRRNNKTGLCIDCLKLKWKSARKEICDVE